MQEYGDFFPLNVTGCLKKDYELFHNFSFSLKTYISFLLCLTLFENVAYFTVHCQKHHIVFYLKQMEFTL